MATDVKHRTVKVRGAPIGFDEAGKGPAVLLVHGLGASRKIWDAVMPALAADFRLLAPDLPGSATSQEAASVFTQDRLADALQAFADELELERFAVVGHSMGATIALELALAAQDRMTGLVMVAGASKGLPLFARLSAAPVVGEALFSIPMKKPSPMLVKLYLQGIFGDRELVTDKIVRFYIEAAQAPAYYKTMLAGLRRLASYDPSPRALGDLKVPTAIVWGERDPLFRDEMGRRQARLIPGARIYVLPGAGHCLPEERPRELSDIVRGLLSARPESPKGRAGRAKLRRSRSRRPAAP